MSRGAEESLLALLEAMLTLAAQDIGIRRPKPAIKPGGYPEEIFVDLTEEEKDNITCNICYQILKDAMQCGNEHKFCHSCLFIWSTTGQYANRVRCPVCRGPGQYYRNKEVDDQVAQKKVRCHLESCRWVGPLLHLGVHRHTTYNAGLWAQEQDDEDEEDSSSVLELPYLGRAPPRLPHHSQSRFTGTGLTARLVPARTTAVMASAADEVNTVPHVTGALLGSSSPGAGVGNILLKDRRTGNTVPVPGLGSSNPPLRLTVRQRIHPIRPHGRVAISHTDDNNNQHAIPSITTTLGSSRPDGSDDRRTPAGDAPHTPRPPSGPRPANSTQRRNLPAISSQRSRRTNMTSNRSSDWLSLSSSSERDSREGAGDGEVAAPDFFNAAAEQRYGIGENLIEIRDRLQESRQRLNFLMSTFSGELERSRQEMADFQIERERQRREQLSEVRELGRRLGQVASELRRLLDQRHSSQHDSSDE